MWQLEPRMMFDGAAIATTIDVAATMPDPANQVADKNSSTR